MGVEGLELWPIEKDTGNVWAQCQLSMCCQLRSYAFTTAPASFPATSTGPVSAQVLTEAYSPLPFLLQLSLKTV